MAPGKLRSKTRIRSSGKARNIADLAQDQFETALAFHRDGDFGNARRLYEEILRGSPDHVGALHLSGLIFIEEKRPDLAETFLVRAISLASGFAPLRLGYGVALFHLGRFAEALANYDKAISINPDYAEAFYNRGNALKELGRFTDSIADYDRVVALEPGNAQAWSNQGDALQSLRRFEEALVRYEKAMSINPADAQVYSNYGLALHDLKRFAVSLVSYDRAITIKPDLSVACFNRGNTFAALERFEEAVDDYAQAILIEPSDAQACANQGDALQSLNRFAQALVFYEQAVAINPAFAQAYSNRGVCLKQMKRFEEALASLNTAIEVAPEDAEAHWNKALTLLLMERFDVGWDLYEWRKKAREPAGSRSFPRPAWLGVEDISNKSVLVHGEQGLGDVIQFSRYLSCLSNRGAKVLFAPHRPLQGLMRKLDAAVEIVDEDDPSLEFDYHAPLMSLPLAFKTNLANIPVRAAYLEAEGARVEDWATKIGPDGFKVGICWQGADGPVDRGRSFPVRHFRQVAQVPGLRLISLQKGRAEAQLQDLPPGMIVETLGADFDAGPDAFLDTAAVMKCCDLVITSDTAVAHLAGALGVKTWVALKHVPDWRWLLDRDDSPWYPSMRLFRQESPGDWDGVFASMKAALVEATPSVRESGSAP